MPPADISIQRVTSATEEQVQASAELFFNLMKDDNGVRSLCGGDSSKAHALACAMLRAGIHSGEYYEAVHKDDGMVGFLMVMPPGKDLFSTEEQRALGLTEFMDSLSKEGKEYYKTTYLCEFPTFVNACLGPTGKTDSWYIHTIMVRPEHQNKGIATALIDSVRAKASAKPDMVAMSTTTDLNAEIYQKVGFAVRGKKEMPSPWGNYPLYIFSLRD